MPSADQQRYSRQRAILSILKRNAVRSQEELVAHLTKHGFSATQSSVSRDLRDLDVAKVGGRYVAPSPLRRGPAESLAEVAHLIRAVKVAGPHLSVVLTLVGAAQPVAIALDGAGWPEIVGTLAGDDTVFVATTGARDQTRLRHRLQALLVAPAKGGG